MNEVTLIMDAVATEVGAQIRDFKEVRAGEYVVLLKSYVYNPDKQSYTWATARVVVDRTTASAVPPVKVEAIHNAGDMTEEEAIADYERRDR